MSAALPILLATTGLPALELTTWAGIAAAAALIGGASKQVMGFLTSVADFVVSRTVVREEAGRALMAHVWRHGRRSPFSVRVFGGVRTFVSPHKRVEVVGYEGIAEAPMLFWLGRTPVVVKLSSGGSPDAHGTYGSNSNPTVSVWALRGTLDLDALIHTAVTAFNEATTTPATGDQPRKRFNVHRVSRSNERSGQLTLNAGAKDAPIGVPSDSADILRKLQHNELRLLAWKADDLIERFTSGTRPQSSVCVATSPRLGHSWPTQSTAGIGPVLTSSWTSIAASARS